MVLSQKFVTFIYSVDKHCQNSAVKIFLDFLLGPNANPELLFYLYVRTYFKIVSLNYFFDHKDAEQNPQNITICKEQVREIAQQAFYFNQNLKRQFEQTVISHFAGNKISYYEFMEIVKNSYPSFEHVNLLPYVLALFSFRQNNDYNEKIKNAKATIDNP